MRTCPKCNNEIIVEYSYDPIKCNLHIRKRCTYCKDIFDERTIKNYYNFDKNHFEKELDNWLKN